MQANNNSSHYKLLAFGVQNETVAATKTDEKKMYTRGYRCCDMNELTNNK